jgi:hypothetical protein
MMDEILHPMTYEPLSKSAKTVSPEMPTRGADIQPIPDRCHLLELPSELLLCIAEYMTPAEKLLTAFTCRILLSSLYSAAVDEVRSLAADEHEEYLCEMLSGLAIYDRVVCAICRRLHDIDELDVPGLNKRSKFTGCWPAGAYLANMSKYCLHQRHVQLALRLSQTGVRNERLKQLLQPYYDSGWASFTPMTRETRAHPLIADGSYLLHIRENFRPLYHNEITIGQCRFLEICPHTGVAERFADFRSSQRLKAALINASFEHGSEHAGVCTICATEFCVSITDSGLTVNAWYDFGTDPRPSSEWWKTHVVFRDSDLMKASERFTPMTRKLRERYESTLELTSN